MSVSPKGAPLRRETRRPTAVAGDAPSEAAEAAEARYRRGERLRVGDPVPPLELARLDGAGHVRLHGFAGQRPLVLLFGSCT